MHQRTHQQQIRCPEYRWTFYDHHRMPNMPLYSASLISSERKQGCLPNVERSPTALHSQETVLPASWRAMRIRTCRSSMPPCGATSRGSRSRTRRKSAPSTGGGRPAPADKGRPQFPMCQDLGILRCEKATQFTRLVHKQPLNIGSRRATRNMQQPGLRETNASLTSECSSNSMPLVGTGDSTWPASLKRVKSSALTTACNATWHRQRYERACVTAVVQFAT